MSRASAAERKTCVTLSASLLQLPSLRTTKLKFWHLLGQLVASHAQIPKGTPLEKLLCYPAVKAPMSFFMALK
jgi:hypothetical protein